MSEKTFDTMASDAQIDAMQEIRDNPELTKQERQVKLRAQLKKLTEGRWSPVEEALIEIEVTFRTQVLMEELERMPTIPKMIEKLKKTLIEQYKDQPDLAELLVDSIPSNKRIGVWRKRTEWKDEVERRMRDDALFSQEKRHKLIQSVYNQGLTGSSKHAEMYLKMSGDLTRSAEQDPVQKTFETFSKAMSKKRD